MTRLLSVVGWVGLALVAVLLVANPSPRRETPGEVWLAYPLAADETLRLAVSGGRRVRTQIWMEHDLPWAPDPRATHLVQVEWSALDLAGQELDGGVPWVSLRSSWERPEALDGRLDVVASGPDPERALSDPRTLLFETPDGTSFVELRARHLPEGARVFLVAFEEDDRDAVAQVRAVVGADAARSERAAEKMGPWGWDELPLDWRRRSAEKVWRRVASASQEDRPLRVGSAADWLGMDDAAALGISLPPGGAAAYNLEGEVVFEAHWRGPDGVEPRNTRTWLEVRGEGLGDVRDLGRVADIGPLAFGPGVREIRIARDPHDMEGPALLRTTTEGPLRDRAWGDPPRLEGTKAAGDAGRQAVGPDLTGLVYWRVAPGEPLSFELPEDHEIRVLARPRLPVGTLPALGPGEPEEERTVTLERVGQSAWTRELPVVPIPSAFERYTQGDDPSMARVSEATEWFLAATGERTTLHVRSEDVVDVQVFVKELAAPSDVPEPGYPVEVLGERLRARYLPYARRTWRARYPMELDTLAVDGRAIRIDAQVRWTYRGSSGPSGLAYRVLELPPPFELVAEPKAGGPRTRLSRQAQRIEVPPTGRVLVDYKVDRSMIGQEVRLQFEGRTEVRELLTAAGSLRVEGLPPGPLRASVDRSGVFLANVLGARPWTVRRVWRLDPGRPRRIAIPAGGEGLSVHFARRSGEDGGVVSWRLRGEGVDELPVAHQRREGRVRMAASTGTAEVLSRAEGSWHWAEPLRLWLGSRLEGAATLELEVEERREPVWIWVSSTWAPPTERLDERHWVIPGVTP